MRKHVILMIFAFLLVTPAIMQSVNAAGPSWYPGKGLKQGDYFSYNVCWTDWHNCAPLQMNFWIKNETSDGTGWNVLFMAIDGSNVQKGIMTIGKITPDPTSSDPNISNYAAVYRSTVSWLDAFSTKLDPKTFDVPAWGRTGSVGGQSVGPLNQEKVTVGAGTFNTWVLGWHKGIDNKIWVDPNIAFPVKALVYVDVTTGFPPPDYTLELLKTGNSPTEPTIMQAPSSTTTGVNSQCDKPNMEQDSVHQTTTTDSSSAILEYRYSPSNPHNGCPIQIRLSFEKNFDPSQKYSNVQYDIFTVDDKGIKLSSLAQDGGRPSLFAPVGDDDKTFVLKGTTPTSHVVVALLGTGPQDSLQDTSLAGIVKIDIKTQESFSPTTINPGTTNNTNVIPEFPLSSLMVMAIVVGIGVLFYRLNPRLFNIAL
ncbi:MAG TPA: hypothetical protein VK431_04770 [Nitrosopumilaceae archaeon]|nr:hypothetical protein [Nitrosopumilaceae archaeon]